MAQKKSAVTLKEITDSIEQGIRELFESEKYRKYLITMSRFHRYSVNNQMLIYMQRPDATHVAGFNKWRDSFGRNVMKGEKGMKIIAPTPYKKKIEQAKLDPDTKLPMLGPDGKAITEEKEIKIPRYKPVTVFDVSQTEGKPLPQLTATLTGDVQNYDVFMEALKRSAPVPLDFEVMAANMDGYFSLEEQRIAIRKGMSEVQTVCAAVHEIAHSKLHNSEVPKEEKLSRATEEIQAESISFAVCAYYGIETGANSFGYLATWAKDKDLKELRASLEIINKASSALITDIDRNYAEIMKERGLDKEENTIPKTAEAAAVEEAAAAPVEPPRETGVQELEPVTAPDSGDVPDPAISVESMNAYGYTDANMLPLTKDRALELLENDVTVYMLYTDNTEAMAFDTEEIQSFDGIFGIEVSEWETIKDRFAVHTPDYEKAFQENPEDSFIIYQLRRGDDTVDLRFMGTDYLDRKGLAIDKDNYAAVYAADLMYAGDTQDKLNGLYTTFNINRPEDFRGHSLSVSDIVALKQAGVVSYHYVDTYGFTELQSFQKGENYLKTAELSSEDDYGMIDGVINNGKKQTAAEIEADAKSGKPVSLLSYVEAVRREQAEERTPKKSEKKPSVLAKLRPAVSKPTKTAPKKGAERER